MKIFNVTCGVSQKGQVPDNHIHKPVPQHPQVSNGENTSLTTLWWAYICGWSQRQKQLQKWNFGGIQLIHCSEIYYCSEGVSVHARCFVPHSYDSFISPAEKHLQAFQALLLRAEIQEIVSAKINALIYHKKYKLGQLNIHVTEIFMARIVYVVIIAYLGYKEIRVIL